MVDTWYDSGSKTQWKLYKYKGGTSHWGKPCARWEAQHRPMHEQDCNQSEHYKSFVNCKEKTVSTHEHLEYKTDTPWQLILHFLSFSRLTVMHPKKQIFFIYIFLCTVNIQKHWQRNIHTILAHIWTNRKKNKKKTFITFKRNAGWQVPTYCRVLYELWTLNPWITKTNKQMKI